MVFPHADGENAGAKVRFSLLLLAKLASEAEQTGLWLHYGAFRSVGQVEILHIACRSTSGALTHLLHTVSL